MRKHLKWLIAVVAAGLVVTAVAIPAFAAGPQGANSDTPITTEQSGYGYGNCQGLGFGPDEAVTELLGITKEQIREQRQSGLSLVQIAASKGVTEDALINAIMTSRQTALQEMVSAGTITQEQADLRLAQIRERVQLAVNRTMVGAPDWARGNGQSGTGNGSGIMRQGGLGGNQENCTGTPGTCTGAGQMMRTGRAAR